MTTNIVNALFGAQREATTRALHQYDYGQRLIFADLQLPQAYEVHFGNDPYDGETVTQIGDSTGVVIPDACLLTAGYTYAWVFLHTGEDDGETRYLAKIPVTARSMPTNQEPTPVQQDAITEAIAALNTAVEQTAADVVTTGEYASQAGEYAGQAHDSAIQAGQSADAAAGSEATARGHAQEAERQAGLAEASTQEAERQAGLSAASAESAAESADHAEQAAANAGYMFFYIDEHGHLIYQRTPNTEVDFYLSNGHLFARAAT